MKTLTASHHYVILTIHMDDLPIKNSSLYFWRNLILFFIFFITTPIALATSIFAIHSYSSSIETVETVSVLPTTNLLVSPQSGIRVYASLPASLPSISADAESADARVAYIRQYLAFYNSPLEPYSEVLVTTADENSLDYRLTTAIAMKESGLCKVIPPGGHNCWGWGIHSEGTLAFDSFEEGIQTVSRGLKENYIDLGYVTLEEIMSKYTPLSKGTWSEGVGMYMTAIEDL